MELEQEKIKQQQKESWNKFSPGWKKWDELLMNFLKPMGDAIIDQLEIKSSDIVLDIAAGTGEPGLTIATMAKEGKVVSTDLSEEMLLIANDNAKALGLHNFSTQVADAGELPFDDDTFDKISCRMGFMFFPDMQVAAREMYRVLKPGGILSASFWGPPAQNFWITGIIGIINKYVQPAPPVPGAPGMFRCAPPGLIAGLFSNAGFSNISEQTVTGKGDYADTDTYWQHMMDCAAPVVAVMTNSDEATKAAIKKEVYDLINANTTNGRALLDFGAIIITGHKPIK
jgi:ubiquinone/menaquinone biosynthesis C-methylase UbiE